MVAEQNGLTLCGRLLAGSLFRNGNRCSSLLLLVIFDWEIQFQIICTINVCKLNLHCLGGPLKSQGGRKPSHCSWWDHLIAFHKLPLQSSKCHRIRHLDATEWMYYFFKHWIEIQVQALLQRFSPRRTCSCSSVSSCCGVKSMDFKWASNALSSFTRSLS